MLTMLIAFAAAAAADAAPPLRPGLEPLAFLTGHCWRGEFKTGELDTHCFEPVYGGQHLRDRHEVTGGKGVYKGETIYSAGDKAAAFTYWNSQGGVSRGTMRAEGDRLEFGGESYTEPSGRRISISTHWRRTGEDAYEAVTVSPDLPSLNRTVRYSRVDPVSISSLRSPDGSHALVHETIVAAPAADVWEAISTPRGWTTWAVPVAWGEADLLETSYSPTASRGDATTIQQRIAGAIPGRMILFRTIKAPQGFPNFETFKAVTHAIELEPVDGNRTRVRLTSAGYADSEAGRQLLGFFRDGNRVSLEQLRQRFATGPIDWNAKLAATAR